MRWTVKEHHQHSTYVGEEELGKMAYFDIHSASIPTLGHLICRVQSFSQGMRCNSGYGTEAMAYVDSKWSHQEGEGVDVTNCEWRMDDLYIPTIQSTSKASSAAVAFVVTVSVGGWMDGC